MGRTPARSCKRRTVGVHDECLIGRLVAQWRGGVSDQVAVVARGVGEGVEVARCAACSVVLAHRHL